MRLIDADKLERKNFSECMDSMEMMCIVDNEPTIKAIPLDEIKQVRERIMLLDSFLYMRKDSVTECVNANKVLGILDRLIKEYEKEK